MTGHSLLRALNSLLLLPFLLAAHAAAAADGTTLSTAADTASTDAATATAATAVAATTAAASQAVSATSPTSPGNIIQVLLGLIAVLALMAGAAWMLRRMGVAGTGAGNVARVIGGVSVGNRERLVVVEVADQWIVVGVAPGRVSAISTMPRQEVPHQPQITSDADNFASWLKKTIDKRNAR